MLDIVELSRRKKVTTEIMRGYFKNEGESFTR